MLLMGSQSAHRYTNLKQNFTLLSTGYMYIHLEKELGFVFSWASSPSLTPEDHDLSELEQERRVLQSSCATTQESYLRVSPSCSSFLHVCKPVITGQGCSLPGQR